MLDELTDVLGIACQSKQELLDEDIEKLIAMRQEARKRKTLFWPTKYAMS